MGPLKTIESALRMSASPVAEGALPSLGGDTESVLREAGYSSDDIARLSRDGVTP